MADIGKDAYRIWHTHHKALKKYAGIRDFVYALAQEKTKKRGSRTATYVKPKARAFGSIKDEELDIFLIVIDDALKNPSEDSTQRLKAVNKQCAALVSLAQLKRLTSDPGAAANMLQQQQFPD